MKHILFTFIFTVIFSKATFSQVAFTNMKGADQYKNGTTYVLMNDPQSPKSKEFAEVMKKTWNFSPLQFIHSTDVGLYLEPQNTFLSLTFEGDNTSSSGCLHFHLALWTLSEKYLKKKEKKMILKEEDKMTLARVELYADYELFSMSDKLNTLDYDAGGHLRNWGPGFAKNHLQQMMKGLSEGKDRNLFTDVVKADELKKFSTETLYVPDYVLKQMDYETIDDSKRLDPAVIFKDYAYKYEVISAADLNSKILAGDAFSYINMIVSCNDKFVNIVNAQNGDIIYSNFVTGTYNIQPSDLKILNKKISSK